VDREPTQSDDADTSSTSPEHQLHGDERMYTGEPVETETGLRRPQPRNVGGEWPDPDAPPAPGASGWSPRRAEEAGDDVASGSRTTTDHDEIREWADAHGGRPVRSAAVSAEGAQGTLGIDFFGGRADRSLEPLGWDEWFRIFDEDNLALLIRDEHSGGAGRLFEFVRR
jgi:hypothetical protein